MLVYVDHYGAIKGIGAKFKTGVGIMLTDSALRGRSCRREDVFFLTALSTPGLYRDGSGRLFFELGIGSLDDFISSSPSISTYSNGNLMSISGVNVGHYTNNTTMRIGSTELSYYSDGKLMRCGCTDLSYHSDGRLMRVGFTDLGYDSSGALMRIGSTEFSYYSGGSLMRIGHTDF